MCRCKRCKRELTSIESIKRGYGKFCYRIVQLEQLEQEDKRILDDLLVRVRKLELDNNFMKCQLKHKVFVGKSEDSRLNWDVPEEVKEIKNEYKIEFNVVIKELKVVLNNGESIFEKDFRFDDKDIGIKTHEEIIQLLN